MVKTIIEDELALPKGKTCSDCVYCRKCCAMFGAKPDNVTCDFYPVRFYQRKEENNV